MVNGASALYEDAWLRFINSLAENAAFFPLKRDLEDLTPGES